MTPMTQKSSLMTTLLMLRGRGHLLHGRGFGRRGRLLLHREGPGGRCAVGGGSLLVRRLLAALFATALALRLRLHGFIDNLLPVLFRPHASSRCRLATHRRNTPADARDGHCLARVRAPVPQSMAPARVRCSLRGGSRRGPPGSWSWRPLLPFSSACVVLRSLRQADATSRVS